MLLLTTARANIGFFLCAHKASGKAMHVGVGPGGGSEYCSRCGAGVDHGTFGWALNSFSACSVASGDVMGYVTVAFRKHDSHDSFERRSLRASRIRTRYGWWCGHHHLTVHSIVATTAKVR